MGVYTRKDSRYYWIAVERPGLRPLRRPTKLRVEATTPQQAKENRRVAELEYHAALRELAEIRLGLTPETPATAAPTLRAFLASRYGAWLTSQHGASAIETRRRLDTEFVQRFGDLPLDQITPARIAEWRTARLRKVRAQTADRDLNALRGLLTRAVEWHILPANPLAGLQIAATHSAEIVRYLSTDEEARLLAAMTARDAEAMAARQRTNAHRAARRRPLLPVLPFYADALSPLVLVALHTGMRRGELFHLDWRAIDWTAKVVTVEGRTAKTKRTRRVPLNAAALTALQQWKVQTAGKRGLVFPGEDGAPLVTIKKGWAALLESAGITGVRFHDLRHTFASKLVQRGVSLQVVAALLGHATVAMTQRYAHLAPDQLRAAVDSL